MAKNVLIFSDGTGQAGGLMPDETRSNVYKLFRATRCGPDSSIDPLQQLSFYDPGLGSKAGGAQIKFRFWRSIYNWLSAATGLGITRNIIDCYAAIIQMWSPGDRIYLFGFSRGAYTVRCLGGVLGLCGVPTHMSEGTPLKRDPASAKAIASVAVKNVYQFGSSVKNDPLKAQREDLARVFRSKYGSAQGDHSNAVPYFIGVWDTVSTLGMGWRGLIPLAALVFAAAAAFVKFVVPLVGLAPRHLSWAASAGIVFGLVAIAYTGASLYYRRPLSLAKFRMAFYDTKLNRRVAFARHALSIDENRKDFARVLWDEDGAEREPVVPGGPERFVQMWFAGCHSDIGGSYSENESRLSDITLKWMADQARSLPSPILVDETYMRPSPSSAGPQHDERKKAIANMPSWFRKGALLFISEKALGWPEGSRDIPHDAPLHPTVIERFELPSILAYDETIPYRPGALKNHDEVRDLY
ncbi:Uncharacterized protein, PA2063/DUF2235 family [Rhizobiales bacterium GAS113]|nr:Uncharacterized protein, PA2063/DUF2235 family [Rhizobiales bacterium GAS113]